MYKIVYNIISLIKLYNINCVWCVPLIMGPKKSSSSGEEKRKVVRKSIEFKKELIVKYESGVRVSALGKEFGMAKN